MSYVTGRRVLFGQILGAAAVLLAIAVIPASAAAAPPTPVSSTLCGGPLAKDPAATPTSDDPNLIDYRFHCDGPITAYTLIANRRLWDYTTIDDFSSDVAIAFNGTPVTTENVTCEAELPGDGINCNAGPGGSVAAWHDIEGSFDLTEPYCKNIPAGARPGTAATPQAIVQLVVTDATGAQDGPFRLNISPQCPRVPDKVPFPPKKPTKKHTTRHKATWGGKARAGAHG